MPPETHDARPSLDRLPYPVARYAGALFALWDDPRADPVRLNTTTLNCFEFVVRYLGLVLLADTWPRRLLSGERKRTVVGCLYEPALGRSLGLLYELSAGRLAGPPGFGLRLASRFAAGTAKNPKTAELYNQCTPVAELRNKKYGHGFPSAPDRPAAVTRAEFLSAFQRTVELLHAVAELPPVVRVLADGTVEEWTGLAAPAAPRAVPGLEELAGRCVLLPADEAPTSLHPLMAYVPGHDKRERLHLYDTIKVTKAGRATAVLRSYETGEPVVAEAVTPALEGFFQLGRLADLFKRQRWAEELLGLEAVQKADALIEDHADIVGEFRTQLAAEVRAFVEQNESGIVVIQGQPGMGKTALISYLIDRQFADYRSPRPACFFFRRLEGMTSQALCHQTLYSQLVAAHGGHADPADVANTSPEGIYVKLSNFLYEKLPQMLPPNRKQLVMIDALDEADRPAGADGDMAIFRRLPTRLPRGVFLIVSTRPVSDAAWFASREGILHLDLNAEAHAEAHEGDGLAYIDRHLAGLKLDLDTARRLSRFAAGNFLLLEFVRKHLTTAQLSAVELAGLLDRFERQDRSDLMAGVYQEFWDRMKGRLSDSQLVAVAEVAGVLAAALAPVPRGFLHAVLEADAAACDDALAELQEYLGSDRRALYPPLTRDIDPETLNNLRTRPQVPGDVPVEEVFYRLFHKSFADFIKDRVYYGSRGHRRLAEYCRQWAEHPNGFARSYALRNGPTHLARGEQYGELAAVCSDIGFLAAKAGEGLVFDLCQDLERALAVLPSGAPRREEVALLSEAVQADAYFLHRHPAALRQSLHTRGWWYDDAAAGPHYAATGEVPWTSPRLAPLLTASPPRPPWVRSLRPPSTHLGGPQRLVIRGHADGVETVAVFAPPNGRALIASAGGNADADTAVRVWDAESGQLLKTLRGHTRLVHRVRFSPDGRRLLTASADGTVRVWDVADRLPPRVFDGHTGNVDCAAFSPCGQWAVSGARDGAVLLREVDADAPPVELYRGAAQPRGVAFHPDGTVIAAGFTDGRIRLWEFGTSPIPCQEIAAHEDVIYSVAFSPDGRSLASGSRDGVVYAWDWERGELDAAFEGHGHWVYTVAFSPDGRSLLSASRDGTVRVWCADRSVPAFGLEKFVLRGHDGAVYSAAFRARDGNEPEVVSGGADGTVRLWHLDRTRAHRALTDHAAPVRCVAFTPDGSRVLTGAGHLLLPDHHTVRVWDAVSGVPIGEELRGHRDAVLAVAGSNAAARVVTGSRDRTVGVWEAAANGARREIPHEAPVCAVAVTADGNLIATGTMAGRVRVWSLVSGEPVLLHEFVKHSRVAATLAFHPAGAHLLSGGFDGTVWLYDLAAGSAERVGEGLRLVTEVAVSPDGKRFGCLSRPLPRPLGSDSDPAAGEPLIHQWSLLANGRVLPRPTLVGYADLRGVVGGAAVLARVDPTTSETVLTRAAGGPPIAWFPESPEVLATHPCGGTWAGANAGHLTLLQFCGT